MSNISWIHVNQEICQNIYYMQEMQKHIWPFHHHPINYLAKIHQGQLGNRICLRRIWWQNLKLQGALKVQGVALGLGWKIMTCVIGHLATLPFVNSLTLHLVWVVHKKLSLIVQSQSRLNKSWPLQNGSRSATKCVFRTSLPRASKGRGRRGGCQPSASFSFTQSAYSKLSQKKEINYWLLHCLWKNFHWI